MSITIALCQYDIGSSVEEALSYLLGCIADQVGAELFIAPEMCLTGFTGGAAANAFRQDGPEIQALADACTKYKTHFIGTFCIAQGEQFYNRAVCLGPSGVQALYDKRRPFIFWREKEEFTAGTVKCDWRIGDWLTVPTICFDLRFPEFFRESAGADLFIVPANWPASRRDHWLALLKARAIENQAYVVGVNRIGLDGEVLFSGDSVIYDYRGRELLHLGESSACNTVKLSHTAMLQYRKRFPFLEEKEN